MLLPLRVEYKDMQWDHKMVCEWIEKDPEREKIMREKKEKAACKNAAFFPSLFERNDLITCNYKRVIFSLSRSFLMCCHVVMLIIFNCTGFYF